MGTHPIFESDFDCLTAFRMLLPRLCQPIVQRNLLLHQKAINGISLYRNASAWTRMKQFLKQHGTVFLVVKFGSFTPLMLLCYKIPSAFGYDGISEFILAQEWLQRFIDVEAHMPDPEDPHPPKFLEWGEEYTGLSLPAEYKTKTFMFEFAATWVIYEFIIAPVKWPYYFVMTKIIVNFMRKRGWMKAAIPRPVGQKSLLEKAKEKAKK